MAETFTTPNGARIDNYYNGYDSAKHYERVLLRDGRPMMASEINELQSIALARHQALGNSLYKDGDIIAGAQIAIDKETGIVTATAGKVFLDGQIWDLETARFQFPLTGDVAIGARIVSETISEIEDPSIRNPAIGTETEGEAGGWRLKMTAQWGFDIDGQVGQDGQDSRDGQFYPVYDVTDGEQKPKEAPPAMDGVTIAISRYDRDSTAGGCYVCSGLEVSVGEGAEKDQLIFTIAEGKARVNGEGVEFLHSWSLKHTATPDLRFVDTEVHTAKGGGRERVDIAHAPVREYVNLRVPTRKTVTMTHGNYSGCQDALPDSAVLQIVEVRQGDVVFAVDTDYVRSGDMIDWAPSGNEPATGSSYTVVYDYLNTDVEPIEPDFDGFYVENAVAGSSIMISYNQALPRIDRLCLAPGGDFSWALGVASEYAAREPQVPEGLLAIATITHNWRGLPQVKNDGVRVVPFSDIVAIREELADIRSEVARNRLEMDAETREAGARAGFFVDPLEDDDMRDQGIDQTAAILDNALVLPVAPEVLMPDNDLADPKTAPFTLVTGLAQTLRTGSMKVNPYMAFTIPEGKAEITPSVDRWTERQTRWASQITRRFYSSSNRTNYRTAVKWGWRWVYRRWTWGWGWGWDRTYVTTSTSSSTTSRTSRTTSYSTQNLGTRTSQLEYLREIIINYVLSNFGPGEILDAVNFAGQLVSFSGQKTADANGQIRGNFKIPPKVTAGVKQIEFKGRASRAYATFTGQGSLEVTTLRRVRNITTHTTRTTTITTTTNITRVRYYDPDPLAQTFSLEADCMLAGVELWFTARGTTNCQIQLREVENGYPTGVVLAEAQLTPAQEKTDGTATRALFSAPVPLKAGTEYAIAILCNDPDTAVAIAQMGKFDAQVQKWVTAQPYTIGVLLSSSNASTWTAHQDSDLTFRLLLARFTETESEINLGSLTIPEGTTDLILKGLAELPDSSCRAEYELKLPDGAAMTPAMDQGITLSTPISGRASVKARLYGSASMSPVFWPGTELICGRMESSGNYVTRSITATGAKKVVLIYNVHAPSGSQVTARIRLDNGNWQDLPAPTLVQQGDGIAEARHEMAISEVDLVKVELVLSGTPAARPEVYDVRLMTTK